VHEPVAHEGLWTALDLESKIGEHLHAHLEGLMPVSPGKSRVNLTLPETLLADLQQEAKRTNRSVSDLVAATIQDVWQADETKLAAIDQKLTRYAGNVEGELAEIQQLLSKIIQLLEGQDAMAPQQTVEPTEQPKVVSAEEMYGPITRAEPAPPAAPVNPPPRRPWWNS